MKTLTITKAVLAAVLTLTPALALTSSAQAAPNHPLAAPATQAPAPQRGNTNANWSHSRNEAPRFAGHASQGQGQSQRFEPSHDQYEGRNGNHREQARFEPRHDDNRFEPRHDDNRFEPRHDDNRFEPRHDDNRGDRNRGKSKGGNDTGKIIGAGIVGAILGAVLSR